MVLQFLKCIYQMLSDILNSIVYLNSLFLYTHNPELLKVKF